MDCDIEEYTPQEAAAIAGVRLGRIQNAITKGEFGRRPKGKGRRRRIDRAALLTVALLARLGKDVYVKPKKLYETLRTQDDATKPIIVGEVVTIDVPHVLGRVINNLEIYDHAREWIECNPEVMGGIPVIRGTRLPVRMINARLAGGDTVESIIEDYPYLDRETIEAANLFAQANPTRGRPTKVLA